MMQDILFLCAELELHPNFDVSKRASMLKLKVEGFNKSSTKLSESDRMKTTEYLLDLWMKEYNELMKYSLPKSSNLLN